MLAQSWTARNADGQELLVEDIHLDETAHRPGVLGGNRVLGSVAALGFDLPVEVCPEGRMDLDEGGTVWRRLAADAHRGVPDEAWRTVRDAC